METEIWGNVNQGRKELQGNGLSERLKEKTDIFVCERQIDKEEETEKRVARERDGKEVQGMNSKFGKLRGKKLNFKK